MRESLGVAAAATVLLALSVAPGFGSGPKEEVAALAAAERWLGLVDRGEYGQSWAQASSLFREAVTREDWKRALRGLRTPLGRLVSRKLKSREFTGSLPGAPEGSYLVIQYQSSFERKKEATETVTPMLDRDGRWRVSGYFVK